MTKTATDPLHVQFDAALMDTYHRAKHECRYNATYLLPSLEIFYHSNSIEEFGKYYEKI